MNEEMRIEAIELSITACEKYSSNYEVIKINPFTFNGLIHYFLIEKFSKDYQVGCVKSAIIGFETKLLFLLHIYISIK